MSAVLPASAERDVPFDASDFQRVRSLIRAKAGIDLHPGKQNMVYGRLSRRLRETRHESFRSYLDDLERTGGDEWQEFINCLTTNLTAFFREAHHFEILATHLRARPQHAWSIWSCASSTGEEPYSIAMTALEAQAKVAIEASDIDTRVLVAARDGVYAADSVQGLGEARLRRFFLRGAGPNAGKARVRPELRQLVNFRAFNLLGSSWPRDAHDAVFCRNVMIYFDRPTQRQVLERLHAALRPGGLLFAGHSENFAEHRDLFTLTGKTVYRRVDSA
ncbi:CheR family methyltransferase [Ramlibacter sp. MMS24-I3-19]|uniref:CheR family methyltransferase n=1 Tax=Ramlibacter sp. MMS24-I3-19 TaxID=3416606 RepID=UPI003D028A56